MLLTDIQPGQELTTEEWLKVEIPLAKGADWMLRQAAGERALIEQQYRHDHKLINHEALRMQVAALQATLTAVQTQLSDLARILQGPTHD